MVDAWLSDLLPRSVPENIEYLRAFVRSGYRVDDVESREVDQQDNIKYFLNNLTGIIEDGSLTRVWKTQRDISERREIERALRQSEELYRTVIEQAAENIYLVDLETKRIIESNAALHRSLGYTMEELREQTLYDIIAQDRESIDQNLRRIVDEGHFLVGERKYRCKDGLLIDVEVSASIISYKGKAGYVRSRPRRHRA
jgi:PAS domain S-box-containing protein